MSCPRWFPLLVAETADQAQTRAMPAEGPRPMAGCAPAPSDDALRPLCLPRAEAQLLQPAVFLTTLLHASLTSRVSMAMGPDSIKCLDGGSLGTQAGRRGVKPGKHRAFWEFLPAPHAHQILRSRLVCRRRAPTTRPDSCTGLQPASRPGQSFRSAPAPRLPSHQWEQRAGEERTPSLARDAAATAPFEAPPPTWPLCPRCTATLGLLGPQPGGPAAWQGDGSFKGDS